MRVLIVEARYHESVADALVDGAIAALENASANFERLSVPGALEIPPAIALAASRRFDGYVALGCVLKTGSFHFEMIAAECSRGLMQLGVEHRLCIGNGVVAAESEEEALRMAEISRIDAGGDAARACLALMQWRARLGT
ncbi:MAG TPA: 6,7-dimethyl-8-ribityllumazine synthase [Rhizomicrobium sp.]|jgi:6,7-dimethyl-8-ribityllumazine synthase|nr:6,7-dimethyl-8-ribityllumazine synthase [Rhizomicrobium sp.]